ncbi:MAG: hypothetical protein HOI95_26580 [Chromatiales bacterium]|jgi:hypothetical protein|nr:hypothetical protein [Chromatiales bacterium]
MTKHGFGAAVAVWLVAASTGAIAAEGSCAHREMRAWVDAEEECYHRYGPLTEHYRLGDPVNGENLSGCVDKVKADYLDQRVICDLRGESVYREDGIHLNWAKHRTDYKAAVKRLKSGG